MNSIMTFDKSKLFDPGRTCQINSYCTGKHGNATVPTITISLIIFYPTNVIALFIVMSEDSLVNEDAVHAPRVARQG